MRVINLLGWIIAGHTLSHGICLADGCFVFRWQKGIDINEPTQKAIILYDSGREDIVLQVKYEGPAEEFGWLVPVPGLPEVRKGSMDCFYEMSRLTQENDPHLGMKGADETAGINEDTDAVKVIEIKTVGAYEVAVLSARNSAGLMDWLAANEFAFPKEKTDILDSYTKKHWYFVAVEVDPNQSGFEVVKGAPKQGKVKKTINRATREKLANGELHPLVISFDAEKCVFPLAISAVNGKPSEISLYVLSSEPLMSKTIFDKKWAIYSKARADWLKGASERRKQREQFMEGRNDRIRTFQRTNSWRGHFAAADDPADPQPDTTAMRQSLGIVRPPGEPEDYFSNMPLILGMETKAKEIKETTKQLPRLAGKSWCLTKQVEVFTPEEMQDLEFEPVLPILTDKLHTPDGYAAGLGLAQFGAHAVPIVLESARSADLRERRFVAPALEQLKDPRITAAIPDLLSNSEPRIRQSACYAAGQAWESSFAPVLGKILSDSDEGARRAAAFVLREYPENQQMPLYQKIVQEDGAGAGQAISLLDTTSWSRAELLKLFSSTNLPVLSTAFTRLRHTLITDEVAPLLTNSLPQARMMGLGVLSRIGDTAAVDRIVSMLHDPNEAIRWRVRSDLRRLTGQKLGADPAAYEKWWAANKDTFTPRPSIDPRVGRREGL
jgi:hypothetical protein